MKLFYNSCIPDPNIKNTALIADDVLVRRIWATINNMNVFSSKKDGISPICIYSDEASLFSDFNCKSREEVISILENELDEFLKRIGFDTFNYKHSIFISDDRVAYEYTGRLNIVYNVEKIGGNINDKPNG